MGKPVFSSYSPLQYMQFPDYNFTFWAPLSSLLLDDINQNKGELIGFLFNVNCLDHQTTNKH